MSDLVLVALFGNVGWLLAAFLGARWLGERKTRQFIENYRTYGVGEVKPAEVWMPKLGSEDPMDGAQPKLVGDTGVVEDAQWSEETVKTGITSMMAEAKEVGVPMTEREAREEVLLMLNSQDGEMP